MTEERLAFTIREAAAFLGAHPQTVRKLARKGEIPAFKVGQAWRFQRDALQRWVDTHHLRSRGPKVLVVDDDATVRNTTRLLLEGANYSVSVAAEGSEALEQMSDDLPDVVLLDLQMPVMDGPTTLKAIRETHGNVPVIIVIGERPGPFCPPTGHRSVGWGGLYMKQVASAALAALILVAPAMGGEPTMVASKYRGIRPTDPGGREGLRNPERGLRIETVTAAEPGKPEWGPAHHLQGRVPAGYTDEWWVADCAAYEPWGLTLAQTYVYLDPYVDGPIPQGKLEWLQASFDELRRNGLKAVLRFAYEREMGGPLGPTLERVLQHLEQLTPVIRRNADVIFVMQAGFVGAWGEWHSSKHHLEADHGALAQIVAKVLEAIPPERMTQVRVPKYKRWVLEQPVLGGFAKVDAVSAHGGSPAARIGFNNDGFLAGETCGGTWPEPPHFSGPGNPEFDYMTGESPFVAVDGELFWADQGGKLDGLRAAERLRLHHYSSLSLAHSYSGREGRPYSIDDWIRTPLTVEQARAARLPVSDGYFTDDLGNGVARTQFEYVRDHLGYRIEAQDASFPLTAKAGERLQGELRLTNRGFSTLHNPRPVFVALIGGNGAVHALTTDADPRAWQPFAPGDAGYVPVVHTVRLDAALPEGLAAGEYRVGLWLPDAAASLRLDPRYAVRLANGDVVWWRDREGRYGVNVLGRVRVE